MKNTLFLLSLLVLLLSCNEGSDYKLSRTGEASPDYDMEEMILETTKEKPTSNAEEPLQEQKVIKTGFFTFETASVDESYQKINSWVKVHKGFIQNDRTNKEYDRIHRSLLIRIPSSSFQPLIDSIYKSIKSLDRKEVILKDVTEEFVDIEARLKAKRKLEERYLQLLAKANTVKDMLEIESQIAQIREEIEAKQGRLKYLQNKVSMSTIHLDFYEMTEAKKSPSKTYGSRLWRAVKGGFEGIGNFFIGLVYVWPFLLIGVLVGLFIRNRIRKRKSR